MQNDEELNYMQENRQLITIEEWKAQKKLR